MTRVTHNIIETIYTNTRPKAISNISDSNG